ncbi:MAG: oligoribonuclease, partial [Candidatus Saccharimonas sp.]
MKQAFKPKQILWVDLEMTGLDPEKDRILEVGVVVTDWNFKELATYEGVVKVDEDIINARMVGEFWDSFPAVRTALIEQNEHGKSSAVIEAELLKFINKSIGGEEKVLLAGNSIHQDRRFINQEWHKLDAKLHYRMLDVSAWKVV